jgi:hypothetical protein
VTAAQPGTVNFELDIKQMHTVCMLGESNSIQVPKRNHSSNDDGHLKRITL